MNDLTPLDVRKKKGDFRRTMRGYDPSEVDSFLKIVEDRLEALVIENLALTEKTQRLVSQMEAMEGRENAVQEALVTAQKLREEVQDQSKREADSLRDQAVRDADSIREQVTRETESLRGEAHREASSLRDEAIREAASVRDQARREADLIRKEIAGEIDSTILEAEGLLKERKRVLEELERNRRKFIKGFRTLLERELDSVEVEEARRPLEEIPLELNLRGWKTDRETEAAQGSVEGGLAGGLVSEAYEPTISFDAQDDVEEIEGTPTEGWGAMAGDEPPEGEFNDIVPVGVFDPPVAADADPDLEEPPEDVSVDPEGFEGGEDPGLRTEDAELGRTVDELLEPGVGEDASGGPEPVWFSSLLKQGRGSSELVERWVGKPEEAGEEEDSEDASEPEKGTGGEGEA
jgi:DivIVA domain-containing protein